MAHTSHATVSLVERGHWQSLSVRTVRRIAEAIDVRIEVIGRWRGGDANRLLSRRHSLLAESFARFMAAQSGWVAEPEVSFAVYGERGVIDSLGWHAVHSHLLVVELKTEFTDVNEALGTLDRKTRLARTVASGRGWRPLRVSTWLIVSDTRTNRRNAAEHATLLHSRLRSDGRQLRAFLLNPMTATTGLAFWTDSNGSSGRQELGQKRVRIGAAGVGDAPRQKRSGAPGS